MYNLPKCLGENNMTDNKTVSLIGGHFTSWGVDPNWPARIILTCNGNGANEQLDDTIVVFRDITVPERPSDLYTKQNPDGSWAGKDMDFAKYYYDKYKGKYFEADYADYYTFTNEAVGSDNIHELDVFVAYERNFCELAKQDGLVLSIGSLAGNSPNFDLWKEYYAPWIKEAWEEYGAVYGRHVYGNGDLAFPDGTMNTDQPAYPQRIIDEIEYLKSIGWDGGIYFKETGLDWGYGVADTRFYNNITGLEKALRPYVDNVIGFCWWEAGSTGWDADYTNLLKGITGYMNDNLLVKWVAPSVEPEPEPEKHKVVIVKIPQEYEQNGWIESTNWAYSNYKRTQAASHHDMMTMLRAGNAESYAVIIDPWLPSQQQAIEVLSGEGFTWVRLELGDPISANPLDNLKLGYLFKYQYSDSYNGGRFNDPRNYGNNLHEGLDADVIGGNTDNKVDVLCTYDGTVVYSADSTGGYGKYVKVEHYNNSSVFYTWYCHLDARYVSVGNAVGKGTSIGEVGATGNVTGEHVHFNLQVPGYGLKGYVVDDVVDPYPYLPSDNMQLPPINTSKYDLLSYIKGNGVLYEVKNSSGSQERFQTQVPPNSVGEFWQTKNQHAEQLFADTTYIYRGFDTSPGNNRFYQQQEPKGTIDARWLPRYMSLGEEFSVSLWVQFYNWDCTTSSDNTGQVTDSRKFVAHYNTWTSPYGIILNDVIEIHWVNGGEKYFYARDFGLVGWSRIHDDPNTPVSSAISEIHAPGSRPDNNVDLPNCLK